MKIIVTIVLLFALPGAAFAQRPPSPPTATVPLVATGSGSASADSWVAGAQAGYNWQRGAWVYGLEADISGTHLRSELNTALQAPPPALTATANAGSSIDWYGTFRGRLGWSAGPLLFYGTGGLAYGNVGLHSNISASPLFLSSATSPLRTGWVAGGGIDYRWRPNIILSLAYQYVDLGTVGLASSTAASGITLS